MESALPGVIKVICYLSLAEEKQNSVSPKKFVLSNSERNVFTCCSVIDAVIVRAAQKLLTLGT